MGRGRGGSIIDKGKIGGLDYTILGEGVEVGNFADYGLVGGGVTEMQGDHAPRDALRETSGFHYFMVTFAAIGHLGRRGSKDGILRAWSSSSSIRPVPVTALPGSLAGRAGFI